MGGAAEREDAAYELTRLRATDWKPPQWVRDASALAMNEDMMSNHYSHPRGRPRLLKAISKHYSGDFENLVREGRELKPEEIVVTAGANEGARKSRSSTPCVC